MHSAEAGWVLVTDIGGTHARIGAAELQASGGARVTSVAHYKGTEWASLEAILADYLRHHAPRLPMSAAVVATAGYVHGDQVVNENLPWPLSLSGLRQACGVTDLRVVNDFEALAYATARPPAENSLRLLGPMQQDVPRPVVVLGPGTGFGCAVRFQQADGTELVLGSEAGHIALAASNERELAVLRELLKSRSHVATGHAISGPGLANIYAALCAIDGLNVQHMTPESIGEAGQSGADPVAVEALQMLCGWLGSLCGDLAILYGAGSLYLSGGIIPQMLEFLEQSSFAARFYEKGVMRPFLEQVTVRVFMPGDHGLTGAAVLAATLSK
ncbi:glucokinase [Frateuria aurantia]